MGKQIIIKGADFSVNGLDVSEVILGKDYVVSGKLVNSSGIVKESEGATLVAFPIEAGVFYLRKNTVEYPNNSAFMLASLDADTQGVACPGFKSSNDESNARFVVNNRAGLYNYVCISTKSSSSTTHIENKISLIKGFKNKYLNSGDVNIYKNKARSTNNLASNIAYDTVSDEAQVNAVMIEILNGNVSYVYISDAEVTKTSTNAPAIVTTENTKWILGLDLHKFYQFYSRNANTPYDYTDELQLRVYCM